MYTSEMLVICGIDNSFTKCQNYTKCEENVYRLQKKDSTYLLRKHKTLSHGLVKSKLTSVSFTESIISTNSAQVMDS